MIPVVSDKYRYVFFYNPKSACSVARKLFLDLHRDELNSEQTAYLSTLQSANQDEWHTLNTLFPYREDVDYSNYYKFTLVRHPATRIISSYLNRVVLRQSDQKHMEATLKAHYGVDSIDFSFTQFLDYLLFSNASEINNRHFLPQAFLHSPLNDCVLGSQYNHRFYGQKSALKKVLGLPRKPFLKLDAICKVENLAPDLLSVYQHIFKHHRQKNLDVEEKLTSLPIHNATFVSDQVELGAQNLAAKILRDRGQMPSYQSFLTPHTLDQIFQLFREDFALFNYKMTPDEQSRAFEQTKNARISNHVPKDFDWQHYVNVNADLANGGVDNKALALNHWIHHGRFEDRQYKRPPLNDKA